MRFTGERLVPGVSPRLQNMITEELSRLNFVKHLFAGKSVLDAGCGVGYGSQFIARHGARRVLGVDISAETIAYAQEHYREANLDFCVMDCADLALADGAFDMVCSLELIEHLPDPDRYLSEIARVLKPDGLYFMSTPNRLISSTRDGRASWKFHIREFSYDELRTILESHFEKVEIWGSYVPQYEEHPIRHITKSPLSQIKHFIPSWLRVWVSSSIRFLIKAELSFDDVQFSKERLDVPTFVALCSVPTDRSPDASSPRPNSKGGRQ